MKKLVDIVGAAYANEIMITARQFSAAEAREMGLVHRVVSVAELEKLTREYCDAIAANAPLTMRAAKRIIGEVGKTDYDDGEVQRLGQGVLRQRRLQRRAQSVHGEAQARLQGELAAPNEEEEQ